MMNGKIVKTSINLLNSTSPYSDDALRIRLPYMQIKIAKGKTLCLAKDISVSNYVERPQE
jgi:hypothetical protein